MGHRRDVALLCLFEKQRQHGGHFLNRKPDRLGCLRRQWLRQLRRNRWFDGAGAVCFVYRASAVESSVATCLTFSNDRRNLPTRTYSAVVASFLACHVFDAQEAARGSFGAPLAARFIDDKKDHRHP